MNSKVCPGSMAWSRGVTVGSGVKVGLEVGGREVAVGVIVRVGLGVGVTVSMTTAPESAAIICW